MTLEPILPNDFATRIHDLWENQWLLLTSGDFSKGHYNTMTVAWGSLGYIWNKPFAQVFVRPTRNTYRFMETYPTFTLCAFSEQYRSALNFIGSHSGREGNKIADAGLTPIASNTVAAPGFAEAELMVECHKMYWADLQPAQFLDPAIERMYALKDYHRIYFGEIVKILGTGKYHT